MDLTPDQHVAARACGLAFFPATDEQVRRLTMQRRVFRIDGQPFLATRDGAFYETHATLAALIAGYEPEPPVRDAEPAAVPAEVQAEPILDPEKPTAEDGEPAGPDARRDESGMLSPRSRKPRTPRTRPASAGSATVAGTGGAAAEAPEVEEGAVAPETAKDDGAAPVVQRRRAERPKTPRWMVAGKLRRGRLK